jgi:23S rRNA (uracil1939-C5)-methyltransferase
VGILQALPLTSISVTKSNVKPQPVVTLHEAKVFSLNSDGTGACVGEDGNIDLPFTLPGERVVYEKVKYPRSRRYYLKDIKQSSLQRATPVCPHFGTCGGCLLQHMDKALYAEYKKSLVTKALQSYGLDPFVVQAPVILPFGKRRRINMDAIKKPEGLYLGFHRFKSHQIVDMRECHTVTPALSNVRAALRDVLAAVMEDFQKAKIFLTQAANGIDMSLEIQGVLELPAPKRQLLHTFAQTQNLARFIFKHGKKIDVIYLREQPYVLFDEVRVPVDAYGFLQATQEADQALASHVMAHIPPTAKRILDLFCGRGTLSFPLSRLGHVDAYEGDAQPLEALQEGILSSKRPINPYKRDLFTNPLPTADINTYDAVVVDPPRAGCEAQAAAIAASYVPVVIYVSCNPQTFARDCKIFVDGGYRLHTVTPVDQFAWSPHVEVVSVLYK